MSQKKTDIDYTALQAELEEIVAELQDESIAIDKAMQYYELGLVHIKQLETYLSEAENTVKKLQAKFELD